MNHQIQLHRDLRRLFHSMDFVSRHPALKHDTKAAQRFAEIYQQLGLAWEFLALQCKHRDGWRKTGDGKSACKVCGRIRGVKEHWLLLPREGKKAIGHRAMPNSKRTFPNRKAGTVVNDAIDFHGAKLNLEVLNPHRATSRWLRGRDWTIAADRLVRLEEGGVEIRFSEGMIILRMRKHKRGERPPATGFVGDLPRRRLKAFPILLGVDERGDFVELTVFKAERKGK